MQYAMLIHEPATDFARRDDPTYWGAWTAYIGALNAAGVMTGGNGLQPPGTATTLRLRDGGRHVQDGPFADTKEQLGGFIVLEVADLETALDWAARCPAAGTGSLELRQVLPPMPPA